MRAKQRLMRGAFVVSISLLGLSACESELDRKIAAGAEVYASNCKVCHAQGINGAPILGNKKMWKKRAPQGLPVLLEHATKGFGLMPAKGGNEALSDEEVEQAITFMLSRLESS